MDTPCRILLVGSSIFTLALEAALAGLPEITAARTEPFQLERLAQAFGPERVVIVYEQDRISARLLSQLSGANYTLVSLDAATGIGRRANGRQAAITSAHDLVRLIRQ